MPARRIAPARLARISHELAEGRSVAEIAKRFSQEWGITERQIRTYCTRVLATWSEDIEHDQQTDRIRITAELWATLEQAIANQDFCAAVRMYRLLGQVLGVFHHPRSH